MHSSQCGQNSATTHSFLSYKNPVVTQLSWSGQNSVTTHSSQRDQNSVITVPSKHSSSSVLRFLLLHTLRVHSLITYFFTSQSFTLFPAYHGNSLENFQALYFNVFLVIIIIIIIIIIVGSLSASPPLPCAIYFVSEWSKYYIILTPYRRSADCFI